MNKNALLLQLKIYGADIDGILKRFTNDIDLYYKCLCQYIDEENFTDLYDAMSKYDYVTCFEVAHTLKGVSGNMGLSPMYAAVCDMVESLRACSYDNVDVQYGRILAEYEKIKSIVKTVVDTDIC